MPHFASSLPRAARYHHLYSILWTWCDFMLHQHQRSRICAHKNWGRTGEAKIYTIQTALAMTATSAHIAGRWQIASCHEAPYTSSVYMQGSGPRVNICMCEEWRICGATGIYLKHVLNTHMWWQWEACNLLGVIYKTKNGRPSYISFDKLKRLFLCTPK